MRYADVYRSTGFFDQEVAVTEIPDRTPLFIGRSTNRSVLHVGCCDVPIFDPDNNLHLTLSSYTDRLDGLDVSDDGIAALRRHVGGKYFTSPDQVAREYDVVLASEVLEHVDDANAFLRGLFSVRATQYLISAPHFRWYEQARLEGGVFHERVHPDHRAWYSPYTLLRTLRPFIDEPTDDVEVFVFTRTGSVAVAITKPFVPEPFAGRRRPAADSVDEALLSSRAQDAAGDSADALSILEELRHLLAAGRNLDVLRRGTAWLKTAPGDMTCLLLCADAAEGRGDTASADGWRHLVRSSA